MPELPDITVYVEALERHVLGARLEHVRIASPFVLRTVEPTPGVAGGRSVLGVRSIGKRVVIGLEDDLFLVLHLMITGRLRWRRRGIPIPKRRGLAAFDFECGTVLFTEEGTKQRAGLWVARGEAALALHDPGGIDPIGASLDAFRETVTRERHTLKRVLTDPRLFAGIGNAYSDEILHAARLSPLQLSTNLSEVEIVRLRDATRTTLVRWTVRLRHETGDGFPEKVTAFREGMAVHGRYREPCPRCDAPVQRIRYAENEVDYCARCQTGGRVLADRSLSRLLREEWPKSIDEWEGVLGASS